MKILITGASGFVGSHLVDYALSKGYETYAGVRASSSKAYLQDPRIRFIDLCFSDIGKLTAQLKEFKTKYGAFDYVVHNAGIVNATDKKQFDYINYGFTKNLVDALIAADIVPQKFVYISSLSAFGPGEATTQRPIMHDDLPQPNTIYGKSKLKSEQYLYSLPDFPFVILRPTGIYGPRDTGYLTYIKMVQHRFIAKLGSTPQYITFIYIKDLTTIVFAALESPVVQRAYFVADGSVYTTNEYSDIIKKHLGIKYTFKIVVPLWFVKAITYALDKICGWFGHSPTLNVDKYNIISARSWICDTAPLCADLRFKPEYSLDEGTKETIEYCRAEKKLSNKKYAGNKIRF